MTPKPQANTLSNICVCLCHVYDWVYHSKKCNPEETTDGEKCCSKHRKSITDKMPNLKMKTAIENILYNKKGK